MKNCKYSNFVELIKSLMFKEKIFKILVQVCHLGNKIKWSENDQLFIVSFFSMCSEIPYVSVIS